ncbi:MAG: ABC transporter permease subunit [Candidatus Fermentibacteraceae bacterium]
MTAGLTLREMYHTVRSMGKAGLVRFLLVYVGLLGIVIPLQVNIPEVSIMIFGLLPLYIAGPAGVDAFAGERDRSTLETLLASPISPGRLLAGKLSFCAGFALLASWIAMGAFSLVSALSGRPLPGPAPYLAALALGVLTAVLSGLAGMSVSLNARSARSSQQWYSLVLVAVAVGLPLLVSRVIPHIPPGVRTAVVSAFDAGWVSAGSLGVAAVLILAIAALGMRLAVRMRRLWVLNGG